jgi:hypothetical protein
MTKNLTIQVLEAKHWALVKERMNALAETCEKADPRQRSAIIERFNVDPFYENRFDEIAAQIRELDPNHSFLPENNPE